MGDLDGQVAVVTGGARGIGFGCCEALSAAGASVVIADIDKDQADISAKGLPGPAVAVGHDVRSGDSAKALRDATHEAYGRVDIVVNNAGVGPNPTPVQDLTEAEYDRVMDINARGTFLTSRAFIPDLIAQESGRIVNVSSIVGQKGFGMVLPYVASKFAVRGMTHTMAFELAPHNVTVNAVCPGIVVTDLHSRVVGLFAAMQETSEDEGWDFFRSRIPLGRFQTPRDLGEMVAFLASDRAQNITGASFNVDGGWQMA